MSVRIAIVGVDGAGKTTMIKRLLERQATTDTVVVHCPSYHQGANAPLQALSRACEAYSQSADVLRSFELKAASLYLQMTLFGPVERALDDVFRPKLLVCERHPIVDTLAYGPFYRRMVQKKVDPDQVADRLAAEIDGRWPGGYAAVRDWQARENVRLGTTTTFWELANEVAAMLARPSAEVVDELCRRYRTTLPDRVVFLDVDPAEAQKRVSERAGDAPAELHETTEYLGALRQSYAGSLAALGREYPQMKIVTIATGGRDVDACLDELVEEVRDAIV